MRCFLLILAILAVRPAHAQLEEVTYRVQFHAAWSSVTHPEQFPSNAHFSGLIGATHAAGTVFWRAGDMASPGIEQMAETGGKTLLSSEIDNQILLGAARTLIDGGGISRSPGSVVTAFTVHSSHPFVSLVSMVAPSPDWFVGVSGLSLMQDGRWIDSLTVQLSAWDAGTDSGETYTAADSDTQPRSPITALTTPPFLVGGQVPALGSFTFLCQSGCPTATETMTLPDRPGLALGAPWPNPASHQVDLPVNGSPIQQVDVALFDLLGRRFPIRSNDVETRDGSVRIGLHSVPPGVWLIRVRADGVVDTARIVVTR